MESRARERWTVILLGIATFFLFADQNLMAPNLTMIAREFGFTDVERDQKLGGDIALMFWLFGGTVSLLVGPLTDRVNRRNLFVLMLIIGEVPCFLTGFATARAPPPSSASRWGWASRSVSFWRARWGRPTGGACRSCWSRRRIFLSRCCSC